MKYNEKGKHVRDLQQALLSAGYELPRYGADGHFGEESWDALKEFALDHDFVWAPEISDGLVSAMLKQMQANPVDHLSRLLFFDLRNEPVPFDKGSRFRMKDGNVLRRNPAVVDGIVIHQTGVQFGVNDRQIDRAGGDEDLALARRAKGIPAHAVSFEGFYVKNYPLDFYCYHAGRLNRKTLGLEVDGLYPGVEGDLSTIWGGKTETTFTKGRQEAARAALRFLVEEGRQKGMPIKYIYAHRQSSKTRRADPGEEIWRKVVLEYGVPVLGLETRPTSIFGEGRVIPEVWDPNGSGMY